MLVKIKSDAFIVKGSHETDEASPGGGGSYEVQCVGVDCSMCVPKIKWISGDWLPYVECVCNQAGGGTCNMITKIIIHIDI